MSDYKEFLGKTLDVAIAEACAYYDIAREKLEIEILEDAKTGIFGLVGARKARIRVRRAPAPAPRMQNSKRKNEADEQAQEQNAAPESDAPENSVAGNEYSRVSAELLESPEQAENLDAANKPDSAEAETGAADGENAPGDKRQRGRNQRPARAGKDSAEKTARPEKAEKPERSEKVDKQDKPERAERGERTDRPERAERAERAERPERAERAERPERAERAERGERTERAERPESADKTERRPRKLKEHGTAEEHDLAQDAAVGTLPRTPLEELDTARLTEVTTDVVSRLILAIVGPAPLEISLAGERVHVKIECEDTGLLIGREGQNLAALQYLAARMISRRMEAQVRVQLDTGDYHSRQDSRLREQALELAERVRATGKPQSTRPLSAYQRRVIHLTLQDEHDVQTHSSGDGPLKRVLIQRRKD